VQLTQINVNALEESILRLVAVLIGAQNIHTMAIKQLRKRSHQSAAVRA
jgi:hypothetical protein